MLESHIGGPIILTKIVEAMKDNDESNKEKNKRCQKKAFKQFLTYLYLDNADKTKYGSILVHYNTQQSLGNNQYPKSITESNNVLCNHKLHMTQKAMTSQWVKHGSMKMP